jgi:hypothetical protein
MIMAIGASLADLKTLDVLRQMSDKNWLDWLLV